MKERPILFSTPMVRALLAGTKTQTRRVVKPQPPADHGVLLVDKIYPVVIDRYGEDQPGAERYGITTEDGDWCVPCPYGQPGDRLWVRETWAPLTNGYAYAADPIWNASPSGRWRPSIHMPRAASRILLEVTGVCAQRLQDISDADAKAEGVALTPRTCTMYDGIWRDAYRDLWESINGKFSWSRNPWVWVVEFKRIEPAA